MDWAKLRHFEEWEFTCRCGCGQTKMDEEYLWLLDELRSRTGVGFTINSGFRCTTYDTSIGGAGIHPLGKAADIALSGDPVWEAVAHARKLGFMGCGLKQHGHHSGRFVHFDTAPATPTRPRRWIWTYG